MKKVILYFIFSFSIFSCNFGKIYQYNPDDFIGTDISLLPNQIFYFPSETYFEGNRYFIYGFAYNHKKAIIYISNLDGYIIDYYFSNFLIYENVKHTSFGINNEKIIKRFGRPAKILDYKYIEVPNWEGDLPYALIYQYLTYYKEEKGISSEIISFCFDAEGKLLNISRHRHVI